MEKQIHPDMKIAEIVTLHPETVPVFSAHGLEALVSEDGMRVLAPFLTLGTALRSRGLSEGSFLRLLHEAVAVEELLEAPGLDDYASQGGLTLLALMPCGLKVPFSRAITGFLEELRAETGMQVTYAVEGNVNQELSYYSYVNTIEKLEELPDIIVSSDFNAFYYHRFTRRFVDSGDFVGAAAVEPCAAYSEAGLPDPRGEYSLLGVNPLVIVADLDKVGERPLPERCDDLLDPIWKRDLTLRGNGEFFCHAVLLPFFQEHGAEGLSKLAPNVRGGMHPAQMVKLIDSGAGGALYVMPEFFAHRVKRQERIRIIWPEDGALASPVTLQVKREKAQELKPILDYLTGPQLGQVLVGARFPVPRAELPGELQGKPLKWLGWDYIRENDLARVNAEIDAIFLPQVQEVLR